MIYYAMFKIKSLQYKDLILNSTGCRKSNRLLRQPAHYRIFASQKYAAVLPRYDTASVPCIERSEAFCTAIAERLLSQSAHKCRAVCPHKELQSAFIPFITSERMRYESLRADKRKTAKPFFASRLPIRFRAVAVRGFPKTEVFGKFL